jgi:hypothetical protein
LKVQAKIIKQFNNRYCSVFLLFFFGPRILITLN